MIQDVNNPIGRFVEIDGHIGRAESEDGEIRDVPFRPVGREQPDAIACLDSELLQRIGKPGNAPQEFSRRCRLPAAVDAQRQCPIIW